MYQDSTLQRPRRREYSGEFKRSVLEQCHRPGACVAGVALGHGLNPNMVHRWMREERQQAALAPAAGAFVPLTIPPVQTVAEVRQAALPAPSTPRAEPGIRIEMHAAALAWASSGRYRPPRSAPGCSASGCGDPRDAMWLAVQPVYLRCGAERLLASVVQVFGQARAHHG